MLFRVEKGYFNGTERVHWDNVKDQLYAERIADNAYRADSELEWVQVVEQDGTIVHQRRWHANGKLRMSNRERGLQWLHQRGEHRDGYVDTPVEGCPACFEAVNI